jgi:hypothetical protein
MVMSCPSTDVGVSFAGLDWGRAVPKSGGAEVFMGGSDCGAAVFAGSTVRGSGVDTRLNIYLPPELILPAPQLFV